MATEAQVVKAVLRDSPFLLYLETSIDASMKKLLLVNDFAQKPPSKLMREAILDVMNRLRKELVIEASKDITEWVSQRTFTTYSALQPPLELQKSQSSLEEN